MKAKTLRTIAIVFGFVFSGAMVSAQSVSPYYKAVTNLNPVAYWPLQETAPALADVETNYGSLGAIADAYYACTDVVHSVTGITGDSDPCADFTGYLAEYGSFCAVPTADNRVSLTNTTAFTVELWVHPTNTTACTIVGQTTLEVGSPIYGNVGSAINNATNTAGWSLNFNYLPFDAGGGNCFDFHVYNGTNYGANNPGGAEAFVPVPALGTANGTNWYYVVAVFNGTNAYLYVNLTNVATSTPIQGAFVPDTWDLLTIGEGRGIGNSSENSFGGGIADVAIYSNVLTSAQMANDFAAVGNPGGPTSYFNTVLNNSPVMFWRMDSPGRVNTSPAAGACPVAANYGTAGSGNNENGIYLGGTTPGSPGPQYSGFTNYESTYVPSYACEFNGLGTDNTNYAPSFINGGFVGSVALDSGVMVSNVDKTMNATTNSFSIACWFKANPADLDVLNQGLISHGNSSWKVIMGGNNNGSSPPSLNGDGNVSFTATVGGAGSSFPANYNDGNWHFMVSVYNNSGQVGPGGYGWAATNLIYVDGALVSTLLASNAPTALSSSSDDILIGGEPHYLENGAVVPGNAGGPFNERFFDGSMAQVAFFTNALTTAQISSLYLTANPAGLPPNIYAQPASAGTVIGGTGSVVNFSVGAAGIGTLSYQWYHNSTPSYSGATMLVDNVTHITNSETPQVTISNLVSTDTGYYFAIVNNSYGSATSALASVTVETAPVISAQYPAGGSVSIFNNQSLTLSVTAAGETPLTYQWYTNGVADTTLGTASTYTITAGTSPAVSGSTYYCQVQNGAGSASSAQVTLTVQSLPASITHSPYATDILALNPAGYWPMHETTPAASGPVETNYGSLGVLENGYYADWCTNQTLSYIKRGVPGALADNGDTAVNFNLGHNSGGSSPGLMLVPPITPSAVIGLPFTVEFWYYPDSPSSGTSFIIGTLGYYTNNTVNSGVGGTTTPQGWVVAYNGNGFEPWIAGQHTINNNGSITAPAPAGQWYHVVMTVDAGTNVTVYVNGQSIVTASGATVTATHQWQVDPSLPLIIGNDAWLGSSQTSPGQSAFGIVDEAAVYTNALSASRILQHYNAGTNPVVYGNYFTNVLADSPVMYYHMDAPAIYTPPPVSQWPVMTNYGSVALNGVYNPGTMPGAVAGPNASGFVANNLSGTNAMPGNMLCSLADAGQAPAFFPATNGASFSYSIWFRGHPADARVWQTLFSANDGDWRCLLTYQGKLDVHGAVDITTPQVYNDGNWHQVVCTCVDTNNVTHVAGQQYVYVDGFLVASNTAIASYNNPAAQPGPDVMIGNEVNETNTAVAAGSGRCASADLCEAAFFNSVLSPAQVQSLYNSSGMAVRITTQPVSATLNAGVAFTNTITVIGSGPLAYQWYTNNVAFGGQTNASLILNPVIGGDASTNYYVVVTNNANSATSAVVSLTVYTTPTITSQLPVTYSNVLNTNFMTLYAGASPKFSLSAIGQMPIEYQWYTNGVAFGGQTNTSLTMTNEQVGTNFVYCILTNVLGSATSLVWSASVSADPTNLANGLAPYPQTVLALHPLAYWRLNDYLWEFDNGSGDDGYIALDYAGGNNGVYTNVVLGNQGYSPTTDPSDTSTEFGVPGNNCDVNSIVSPDFATTNNNGEFSVEAWVNPNAASGTAGICAKGYFGGEEFSLDCGNGTEPNNTFRFSARDASGAVHNANSGVLVTSVEGQWIHLVGVCDEANSNLMLYINGSLAAITNISGGIYNASSTNITIGARSSNPALGNDQQFNGYINDVAIFNYPLSALQVANQYASADVPPYYAVVPPASVTQNEGLPLTLSAAAVGTPPMTNTWYDPNGNIIAISTTNGVIINATFNTNSLPLAWNGLSVTDVVANAYGTTNASVAISVLTGLSAYLQYPGASTNVLTAYSNYPETYTVVATGSYPFYYQWYVNNVAVPNATNASYSPLPAVGVTNAITVTVTNDFNGYSATNLGPVFLSGVVGPTDPWALKVLSLRPFAYWRLNESSGSPIAYDYVGGYNGLYGMNTTNGQPGISTAYAGFGSQGDSGVWMCNTPQNNYVTNGCVSVAGGLNLTTNVMTFVSWVYIPVAQNNPSGIIFTRATTACGDQIGGSDDLDYTWDNLSSTYDYGSGLVVPLNTWAMCVCEISPANTTFYLLYSGTTFGPAVNNVANVPQSFVNTGAGPLNIGADENGATANTRVLNGEMDEAAIFTYDLSLSQLGQLYTAATTISVNQNPTNILFSVMNGTNLTLSWPADHTGWVLQTQTNRLSVGLSTNWVEYNGGETGVDQVVIPINLTNGCVFYRLVYP